MKGPLNIARPIQGWPVMVQAGASDAGRQLAAETAEVVFAAGGPIEAGRAFYADVKGRAARIGRNPDHIKILPGAFTIIGDLLDEAKEKRARLDSLVSYDSGMAALSIAVGQDARKFDPDGPLPEIPETNQSKSGRERVIALAKRENLTARQIAGRLGGYGGLAADGHAPTRLPTRWKWLMTEASDGFNVMFPYLPGGLDDFVNKVVPELQRRGLFRTEYEGRTLRENSACRGQRTASSRPRRRPRSTGSSVALSKSATPSKRPAPRMNSFKALRFTSPSGDPCEPVAPNAETTVAPTTRTPGMVRTDVADVLGVGLDDAFDRSVGRPKSLIPSSQITVVTPGRLTTSRSSRLSARVRRTSALPARIRPVPPPDCRQCRR